MDYYEIPELRRPQEAITNGDDLSLSIAAASIVAKVKLDQIMETFDRQYPQYGFARNKGYGSPEHRAALAEHGPSPIHRLSSSAVKRWIRPPDGNETG